MDLSSNQSKEGGSDLSEERDDHLSELRHDFKPKDLSVKPNMKRLKPIPPPLNLISETSNDVPLSTTLKEFAILATGPQSPLMQKNLPFRKRAHSVPDAVENAPLSAPPTIVTTFQIPPKQEAPPPPPEDVDGGGEDGDDDDYNPPLNLSLPPTPKLLNNNNNASYDAMPSPSCSSSSDISSPHPFPPVVHRPLSPRPVVLEGHLPGGTTSAHHHHHAAFFRHHGGQQPSWSPYLASPPPVMHPHWMNAAAPPSSALLSPAPSSIGSSQEDLRLPLASAHVTTLPPVMPHGGACDGDLWRRLPWPQPVWHCFQYGTLIRFLMGGTELAVRAEEIFHCTELKNLSPERLGSLCVHGIEPTDSATGAVDIKFSGVYQGFAGDIQLVATCHMNQTFYVLEKGWCAVNPDAVFRHYGMQCAALECGDCCPLPPKLPPVSSPGICDKFKRFSFSPEELSSPHLQSLGPNPYILSPPSTPTQKSQGQQFAKQQKTSKQKSLGSQQGGQKTSQKNSNKAPLDPDRPKRPMNAFMLFAKQHRLKLIQMHPGKDNRFVSVILGEAWRQLPADQKEVFITEARALSHERKRLHPECWKRKRSQSTS